MKKYNLSLGVAITSILSVFATDSNPDYINENIGIFDFELTAPEMQTGGRHQKIQ